MMHEMYIKFSTIGLLLWVLFMAIILIRALWQRIQYLQSEKRMDQMIDRRKKKEPYLPPLELDIKDTWVKCELEEELRLKAPYQYETTTMLFSFFNARGTNVHACSYGPKESPSYANQFRKLLETTGFEFVKTFNYMDTVTSIYERTSESDEA